MDIVKFGQNCEYFFVCVFHKNEMKTHVLKAPLVYFEALHHIWVGVKKVAGGSGVLTEIREVLRGNF